MKWLLRFIARDLKQVRETGLRAILRYYLWAAADVLLSFLFRNKWWKLYNHSLRVTGKAQSVRPEHLPKVAVEALLTTTAGLFLYSNGDLRRLLRGRFTGLTRFEDRYYVAEDWIQTRRGRVFSFRLRPEGAVELRHLCSDNENNGIHQIDFIGDRLFVTDTYKNNIAVVSTDGELVARILPNGVQVRHLPDRDPDMRYYRHYNSVFGYQGAAYVLANNKTDKSGQNSLIYRINLDDFSQAEILEDVPAGENSHNILIYDDGAVLVCDSLNGTLTRNGEPVFFTDYFTRGLAMNDDFVLMGGSQWAERHARAETDAQFWILDRDLSEVARIDMGRWGPVYDIRLLTRDYGLSNEAMSSAREPLVSGALQG